MAMMATMATTIHRGTSSGGPGALSGDGRQQGGRVVVSAIAPWVWEAARIGVSSEPRHRTNGQTEAVKGADVDNGAYLAVRTLRLGLTFRSPAASIR